LLTFLRESYRSFTQVPTMISTVLVTLGGVVSLVWLAAAIARHVRRRRLLRNLGVVSQEWLTLHRADRW
jgi:hypothetical protein